MVYTLGNYNHYGSFPIWSQLRPSPRAPLGRIATDTSDFRTMRRRSAPPGPVVTGAASSPARRVVAVVDFVEERVEEGDDAAEADDVAGVARAVVADVGEVDHLEHGPRRPRGRGRARRRVGARAARRRAVVDEEERRGDEDEALVALEPRQQVRQAPPELGEERAPRAVRAGAAEERAEAARERALVAEAAAPGLVVVRVGRACVEIKSSTRLQCVRN